MRKSIFQAVITMTRFETTKHFLSNDIDIENLETGEMITVEGTVYRYLSGTMSNEKIFDQVSKEIELNHIREIYNDKASRFIRNYYGRQSTKTEPPGPLTMPKGGGART
jgi:hypothetical protein